MSLSFSQIQLYRNCPKQYEYANVKKIGRPISAGESFGSSVHNTLKKWGDLEMEKGERKMEKEQLEMFAVEENESPLSLTPETLSQLWHQSFIVEGYDTQQAAKDARNKGEKVLQHFFDWWSYDEREVLAVESGFKLHISHHSSPITLSGRFDRVEQVPMGVHVIDFKTSKPRTQKQVDDDLQLSVYALACQQEFGQLPWKLSLMFLREDGIEIVSTHRTEEDLADAVSLIGGVQQGIEEGTFAATPTEKTCGFCPYRGICSDSAV